MKGSSFYCVAEGHEEFKLSLWVPDIAERCDDSDPALMTSMRNNNEVKVSSAQSEEEAVGISCQSVTVSRWVHSPHFCPTLNHQDLCLIFTPSRLPHLDIILFCGSMDDV